MANHPFSKIIAIGAVAISLASCSNETANVATMPVYNEPDPPVWTLNFDDVELGTADFETFDIERDYSALDERLHTDPSKKMYEENTVFEDSIHIKYEGERAIVNCENMSDFSVRTSGAHVNINTKKDVVCTLTGKSENGSLKIVGDNMVRIALKGVSLKNPNGPAISNQSSKICFLVTEATSSLSNDSTTTDAEKVDKQKGCVASKGYLAISGRAPLRIVANSADAIHSGKTVFVRRGSALDIESYAGNGIKAKNKVKIEGGMLNICSMGHGGSAIAAKKYVQVAGGRTTIISDTGEGKNEKNARGIKSDSLVAITGGIVRIKESSVGGKGIRAGHNFLARNCIVDVLTFGEDDKATGSKNRGIKGADEIRIDSSRVRVRTENGWNEALSSRHKIMINNSLVELKARDDAISAGEPKTADIEINGGRIYAMAGMDAIDSNGTVHVNSGLVYVIARSKLCRGFDCDIYEFKIGPEATVVSLGQITSKPTYRLLEHPACLVRRPLSDTDFCLTGAGSNDNLVSFKRPMFLHVDSTYSVLLSLPEFRHNQSYNVCRNVVVKPVHTFHGLQIGGTAESKLVENTFTLTKNYEEFLNYRRIEEIRPAKEEGR